MLVSSLLVVAALIVYFMTSEERARVARWFITRLRIAQDGVHRLRSRHEPLADTLRARTPWAVVTPALIVLHVIVFFGAVLGSGSLGDAATLEQLGANFAPRTTNGEWGRLITSTFLHGGFIELLVNIAALVSVGVLLERLVGPLTFLTVYVGAGVLAGLASLGDSQTSVSVGASGAIFGLYGLLVASWAYGTLQNATTTVRLATVKRLLPVAAVFVLYNLSSDWMQTAAECTGIVTGFFAGVVLGRHVRYGRPPARKVALTMATAAIIAVLSAAPLVGVTDVRPVLAEVQALERRTMREYFSHVEQFRNGRVTAATLATVIDERILPELRATRALVAPHGRVPHEHEPLLAAAQTYLRLREESWRMRASALRKGSSAMLRQADETSTAAIAALTTLSRTKVSAATEPR